MIKKIHLPSVIFVATLLSTASAVANPLVQGYVSFTHKLAQAITQPYREGMGLELKAVFVDYQAQPVSFQYQMWRLRPNSVCLPLKGTNLLKYSQCSMAANQFFKETCQQLKSNPSNDWLYPKYKRLYCNAAASYQPVVAQVRRSKAQKQQCSMLILKAMRTHDPLDIQKRDEACGK